MNSNYLKMSFNKGNRYSNHNFDIKELINNFSLLQFISEARKNPSEDFGGFLIFTPKQYIFGYNSNFGRGSHGESFGRALKDIEGGGIISSENELLSLASRCEREYFCGRLLYESTKTNDNGMPIFYGKLVFMTGKSISLKMFESFKKFCEDYGREIRLAIERYSDTFSLVYYSKELRSSIQTNNLEEVYNYIESHIDYNYDVDREEQIIGVDTSQTVIL